MASCVDSFLCVWQAHSNYIATVLAVVQNAVVQPTEVQLQVAELP